MGTEGIRSCAHPLYRPQPNQDNEIQDFEINHFPTAFFLDYLEIH